jgi:hypothetical protein
MDKLKPRKHCSGRINRICVLSWNYAQNVLLISGLLVRVQHGPPKSDVRDASSKACVSCFRLEKPKNRYWAATENQSFEASAQSPASSSACSRMVLVASSCLLGG